MAKYLINHGKNKKLRMLSISANDVPKSKFDILKKKKGEWVIKGDLYHTNYWDYEV